MSYLDDYKKGLEKRQANPGSTRNSTASNQGDKTVAERSDDYMGEYLRGLERRNDRPVYSSGVGQNYLTNFMKRSNEILSGIKSGTYRTDMQELQELGQQSSVIRKFLHDNPSQFPREVVRILEDRMNELDSAARSTSWAVRTDLLDEARAGMESSQGKSRYQENQEAMAEESARLRKKWEGSLNPYLYGSGGYQPNEHYNMVGQEQAKDYFDLSSMAQEKVWMDTVAKYTGKEFKDNFWGQFGANYTMGRLGQDSSIAWNKYLDDPTEQNRRDAETIDQLITEIQLNNEDTLADDGTLPWISKTLANYIPQFLDQMKYSGSLGAVGALTGNPKGVKAGIVMGSGVYSYMTMRGAAFKSLLEAGIPEEQARAAAKDEAVVSSLIEMGDTAIDLATLGGGKLINVLTAGSLDAIKNQIAKGVGKNVLTKLATALAKYGINIGSEWLEEATQESVSIANQNNPDGGIPGLVQDAAGVFFGSVFDPESEEGQQIREAGEEGAKIAAMMGGIQGVTNAAASRFAANSRIRAAQQGQQVPEQLPPTPKEQRQNDLLQQMPEPIQRESSQADQKTDADVSEPEAPTVTLEDLSAKYGAQAGAMEQTYRIGGGEQDVTQFDRAYEVAYNMGKSGVNEFYAMKSQATSYLTEGQRKEAFQAGRYAAETAAREQADRNTAEANGKTGWKKGVVKGEGVQISDLTKTFNDPQRTAYKTLSTIAEATGIDIVLYKSQTDQDGKFQGAQGKFKWNENAIYIDVNAGLSYAKDVGELSKYTMLRTFGHEFTHFVEKWNPQQYNEFRSTVLDALTEQGMNVEDLIDLKMAQDSTGKLTYDLASREVVAESMTDILQDSTFVEQLAAKNRTLFDTIRSKIKEFLDNIKRYFSSLAQNPSKEARSLQKQMGDTVSYLEDIVKKFDQVAVRAVEQYQATVAEDVQQEKDTETKSSAEPKITKSSEQKQESKTEKDKEKSSQPGTKQGEPAAQEVQPQEYQDDYGFTIRTNSQYGTLEISFTSKPDAAIRDALKANKFRWNGKKGVWYGKADQQAIVDALHGAYAKLEQAPVEVQSTVEPTELGDDTAQSDTQPEIQEAQKPEAEQDVTEENNETEQLEPESIPTQSETEEAKQELRKAVRMPIQGTNMEALLQGIKSRELSTESITLRGTVSGFNEEQRTHLVEKLIEGVYSNKNSIKIDVPYDGKFEIVNSPEAVAKVLDELKVRVNQEVLLDKKTLSLLTSRNDLRYTTIGDQIYLTNGAIMIPSSSAAVEYVKENYNAKDGILSQNVLNQMRKPGTMVTKAPTEAVTDKKLTVYIFDIDGQKQFFDKRYISYFDGNYFYAIGTDPRFPLMRVEDSNGAVKGFIAGVHTDESKVQGEKPSKLKSFSNSKAPTMERRNLNAVVKTGNGMDQVAKKADQRPGMRSADGASTVESSVKLEDFGEKIGGARKDIWNSRGLLVDDLSAMNDRERSKAVKKDNVWKRPDYRKLVEGGESRGILYARNEIRKALNQNITYPYVRGDTAQSPQYLERVRNLQEDFVSTVRDIQALAERARTAEDFRNMGRPWLKEHGFMTEVNGREQYTDKWRKNPALQSTDYVSTVEFLARNFDKLEALAEKKGFAADVKMQVPKGYTIHQDSQEDGTWFVAKGHYILRHHFPSYDDALTFLKQLTETKKRKTRFVPQQLLEVHRKGPDYRKNKNVSGQDYLDTFGFRGGEFGNWLNEKDRQVSLNYGFDALKDLADALQIADTDISLDGNLSIAFGSRGQGLSGAAAHYEPERHVINLTKMKGAGSLAHEWFHALDDFIGGYQEKMATDNQRNLPETTKVAIRNLITTMQYRDATQEETDLAASKRYEQARRSVTFQVNEMFPWVEKLENGRLLEHETKYFNRKPTAEDAKRYHDLLNRLLDTGDASVIEELSEFRKEIYGRVIPKENREAIGYRLFPLKPDAGKNVQKMRQYTDFYTNSRRFNDLYQKDGDYWDSTVEMAARAFACYVADKTSASNDYLSAHSESAVGFDVEKNGELKVIKAFPEGQERTDINAAFDQLISALKDDGFLHEQEETEKPGMIQYQNRKQTEEGDNYGEDNEGRWDGGREADSSGLARGEDSGSGGQSLGSVSAENQWESVGDDQRRQIINQLDLYTYDNPESEFFLRLFEDGDLSNLDIHMSAISKMAQQFYEAMHGNRVLLENDPRFRWLGDSLGLFVQDVENIVSGNFSPFDFDEEFQARQVTFSDRDILEIAAKEIRLDDLTEGERDSLRIFRDRLTRLNDLQERRKDLGTQYREQQFGANGQKVDRAEAEKTRERMKTLDGQIAKAQTDILDVQNKEVLRKVLQKARKIVETKQREKDAVVLSDWRDRRNKAIIQGSIERKVKGLSDKLLKNSNKEHIPEVLKKTVGDFLTSIDFSSNRKLAGGKMTQKDISYIERLDRLRQILQKQADYMSDPEHGTDNGFYLDLPSGFTEKVQEHINNLMDAAASMDPGENPLRRMSVQQLQDMDHVLTVIGTSVSQMNKLLANAHFQTAVEASRATIQDLGKLGEKSQAGKAQRFLQWDNTTPYYAFKRLGEAALSIFEGIQDGWDKMAMNVKKVMDYSESVYKPEEVRAWSKDIREVQLSGDKTVKISIPQAMSLYCLMKRDQAMKHLMGGGLRIGNIEAAGQKAITQTENFTVSLEDLDKITGLLTPRQKEVADKLQRYMNTQGSAWGNEVSMARFGYRSFTEANYFPIQSDSNVLPAVHPDAQANDLFRLLNMSMTKGLNHKANNALVVSNIFDVFADHMSDMAKYNALALPILDTMKWYNFKDQTMNPETKQIITATVQRSIEKAFSRNANSYIVNFIKDLNGVQDGGKGTDSLSRKMISNYKVASVAGNLRVAILQPTAYVRATAVMNPKYLAMAMKGNPVKLAAEAEKYSGIAAWKAMGFYDTNISRGIREQIKNDVGKTDKFVELTMTGAEWGDRLTWGYLWYACKMEVHDNTNLTGEALNAATAKRFRDVVYRTQVVDSTMTRSQAMRDTKGLSTFTTAFMAEPTLSYNMLLDAYAVYENEARRTGSKGKAWKKSGGIITRALIAYTAANFAAALAEGVMDGLRDDDEYETFLEKFYEHFKENFWQDMNPLTKLPFVKDVLSYIDGYDNTRLDTEWAANLVKSLELWQDKKGGSTLYGNLYNSMKAVSQITGLPISNMMREVATIWNNTFGVLTGKKLKTYDSGYINNIKYAYLDGYLTDTEAAQELLDKELAENEEDANWSVKKWRADDNLRKFYQGVGRGVRSMSKTDQLYYAVTNEEDKFLGVLKETYRNQQSLDSAMVSALKENDPRIIQAAQLQMDGDILGRQRIAEEIASEGYFSDYIVSRAWKSAFNELKGESEKEYTQRFDTYTIRDYFLSASRGDSRAVDAVYSYLFNEMKKEHFLKHEIETSLESSFSSQVKSSYMDGETNSEKSKSLLEKYGGRTSEEAKTDIKKWDFEIKYDYSWESRARAYRGNDISKEALVNAIMDIEGEDRDGAETEIRFFELEMEHEDIDITANEAKQYFEFGEPAGVEADTFLKALDIKSGAKGTDTDGDGKKDAYSVVKEVIPQIGELPISDDQKTAIAKALGWGDSTIRRYKTW